MYYYYVDCLESVLNTSNPVSKGDFLILSDGTYEVLSVTHGPDGADLTTRPKRKTKQFKKPTQEEVDAFANESNLQQDGFFDYFESNGWKRGKNPMKDWKAALRGWSKRQSEYGNKGKPIGINDPNMEW